MAAAISRAEVVYHVAGVTKARKPQGYYDGNAGITKNLVETVTRYGKNVRTVVGVSSQAAAGPHPGPEGLDEGITPNPVSHYGRAKLEAERILLTLKDKARIGIVRPPMVYGPRDFAFLPLYSGARLGIFPIPGSRKTLMSIVHVSDLVRGIVQLGEGLTSGAVDSGKAYFLSGQAATWEEIGIAIGEGVNRRLLLLSVPMFAIGAVAMINGIVARLGLPTNHLLPDKYREARQPGWVCSEARARSDFGYASRVELREGMRSTIEWCLEYGAL
jgi:nucleoside-diphosphate-sugar epimerase